MSAAEAAPIPANETAAASAHPSLLNIPRSPVEMRQFSGQNCRPAGNAVRQGNKPWEVLQRSFPLRVATMQRSQVAIAQNYANPANALGKVRLPDGQRAGGPEA